jgi:hypothetical protein
MGARQTSAAATAVGEGHAMIDFLKRRRVSSVLGLSLVRLALDQVEWSLLLWSGISDVPRQRICNQVLDTFLLDNLAERRGSINQLSALLGAAF